MSSVLHPDLHLGLVLVLVAEYHGHLGWDNFLKGCICSLCWVEVRLHLHWYYGPIYVLTAQWTDLTFFIFWSDSLLLGAEM